MGANSSYARLKLAGKKLAANWQEVKVVWRDRNCTKFEKKYMDPLQFELRTALMAIEEVDEMLNRIRHDCK